MARLSLALLLSFLAAAAAAAQPDAGRLAGRVTDDAGRPLAGATVALGGTSLGAATDADGRFVLAPVAPGAYEAVATVVGYREARAAVAVRAGETAEVAFALVPSPAGLGEVVVEARETLTGRGALDLPGSAHYLGPQALQRFAYGDVHRVLRVVPGVSVQEEDGYGLRPNVGLRGSGVERSSKITLMEDGVLAAPAPYASPSAYYFPTVGRMDGVEVRTGASQVRYGPFTTGGALNLLAAAIPDRFEGRADVLGGTNGRRTLHARVGDAWADLGGFGLGFVAETYLDGVDGFKTLEGAPEAAGVTDRTGFDKADLFGRLRLTTAPGARVYQALTLTAGYTDEVSHETYLGLTAGDFDADPFLRYAGSQRDRLDAEHTALRARHVAVLAPGLDVTTTLYRNTFARNWYKLDTVRDGLADDAGTDANGNPTLSDRAFGIAAILDEPERYAGELAALRGGTAGDLFVKANNRTYYSQGVQSVFGLRLGQARGRGALVEAGLRYHGDASDFFQWVDRYGFADGALVLEVAGRPGTDANRVDRARALAGFAQAEVTWGRLELTPGLRVERVALTRDDFGRADTLRTGSALQTRRNEVTAWIPGVGVVLRATDAVSVFGGVHRGFAPPSSQDETRPESSVNVEGGVRLDAGWAQVQAAAYRNAYENLLGRDNASAGGAGTGDQFNGGAVDVTGAELAVTADLARPLGLAGWAFPARVAYTYTDAAFQTSFVSTFEDWGTVEAGDELPYTARHQVGASVGVERGPVRLDLGAHAASPMRTTAGQGPTPADERTGAPLVLDLAGEVAVRDGLAVFGRVENLTDETYVVARRPSGLRPGLPRTAALGLRVRF